jgi:hypothetical protein
MGDSAVLDNRRRGDSCVLPLGEGTPAIGPPNEKKPGLFGRVVGYPGPTAIAAMGIETITAADNARDATNTPIRRRLPLISRIALTNLPDGLTRVDGDPRIEAGRPCNITGTHCVGHKRPMHTRSTNDSPVLFAPMQARAPRCQCDRAILVGQLSTVKEAPSPTNEPPRRALRSRSQERRPLPEQASDIWHLPPFAPSPLTIVPKQKSGATLARLPERAKPDTHGSAHRVRRQARPR